MRRRPATPPVGPLTLDLGPEPPAVVNFLTHGFAVTPEAVPATLLDLAARGVLELERRGPGVFVCRLGRDPEGLTTYEQQVVALLRGRAHEGIVPPEALTIGPEAEAGRWRKAFDGEVVADAVDRGLSRPIAEGRLVAALLLGSLVPGALCWQAVRHHSGLAGLGFVIGAVLLLVWVASLHAQRETPAGLAAASHWLGVREALHRDEVFSTLPPITVGLWARHLAYGVAPGAVRPIPMGAESDTRAWTAYGGRWRRVQVGYPMALPIGWGRSPAGTFAFGVALGCVTGLLLAVFSRFSDLALAAPFLVPPALGALLALTLLWRSAADLLSEPVTVTGELLRLRVFGDKGKRYYAAVDEGTSDRVRAFVVEPRLYARLEQGELVVATVTPHLRHVRSIEVKS